MLMDRSCYCLIPLLRKNNYLVITLYVLDSAPHAVEHPAEQGSNCCGPAAISQQRMPLAGRWTSEVQVVRELLGLRYGDSAVEGGVDVLPLLPVGCLICRGRQRGHEVVSPAVHLLARQALDGGVMLEQPVRGADVLAPGALVDVHALHLATPQQVAQLLLAPQPLNVDVGVELGILQHGGAEEAVEGVVINLGVSEVDEVLVEVV
mmetsp:Transcript_6399/g.16573  ORF Transcript_6399/g.16573 Transcript_6399/m.16573 type:complete len:206 (+) Transcript_6399:57-674(+)